MSKVVATYSGRFDVFAKKSNIKIKIISVPKQKNKIVMTGQESKNINGSLLSVKKLMPNDYVNMYRVIISFQNRGSHQGGPMHNFKDNIALFSKDEKQIDKLLQFLEKHITKKKVRRTKRKSKKGGCGKGGGKKDKKSYTKDKTFRNKYKKISSIDCAKKYPKSRDKTLKCLDQKEKDLKSLESEYPQEMKLLKKEIKEYEKNMNTFMKEANDCKKHMPDMNKVKKCAEEVGKKYDSIFKDNKEISQIYTNNMKDKLQRMIDHTQKVDLGELGKLYEHDKTRRRRKKTQKAGGKKYYGIKNNKVIELYPHKIKKSIGRHKYIILWKTTKENLPGKTFHGKFYKSKEEAMKNIK